MVAKHSSIKRNPKTTSRRILPVVAKERKMSKTSSALAKESVLLIKKHGYDIKAAKKIFDVKVAYEMKINGAKNTDEAVARVLVKLKKYFASG